MTTVPPLPRLLAARLPFHYGWLVLACVCCAGFARQGPAVAVLSIFVEPMTREFGWSRTMMSGAVSLGGVLGAVVAPLLGPVLDRQGARLVLTGAILLTAATTALLSLTPSLLVFYLLFCLARMSWAGPFDLGIYGALNSWFVAHRARANAVANLAQMAALVTMPLIAHAAMAEGGGWRAGWVAIGITVLAVGLLPTWLLMVRRPEDLGLVPDRAAAPGAVAPPVPEPSFTRREALATPAFWLLGLFTMLVFPVQAGVSLHQAAHLIERGIDAATAATVVSAFSAMSALSSIACVLLPRRWPVRLVLAAGAAVMAVAVLLMIGIAAPRDGYLAAGLFGLGLGPVLTLTPVAWGDYFGRRSYGAIRGLALTAQVLGQAIGPLSSGLLRDLTGTYVASLSGFAVLAGAAVVVALLARRPAPPA